MKPRLTEQSARKLCVLIDPALISTIASQIEISAGLIRRRD